MAYMLGAAAVMESLQTDVRDVQSCITDIVSRAGPVQCTSWKFPDKSASALDVEDLLGLYSYSDDDEERQVAHIALYELVIDRLVFLLHTMASYTEGILKIAKPDSEWGHASGTSVGVVVKKYWSRLSQLQQVMKHCVQEKKAMSRKVQEMEGDIKRLDTDLKQAYSIQRPRTVGFGGLIPPNRAEMLTGVSLDPSQLKQFGLISRDEYNKSCQTSETAFTPCESCSMVQKSFRQCGDIVVNVCQQQLIPSCLQKFRPQVSHLDWLSGNDVSRWAAEQYKDLQRISKLTATIKPLRDEQSDCQERMLKLEKRVQNFDKDLKRERDDRTALHKRYETKFKEMENQHCKTVELEQQQRELLEVNKQELEKLLENQKKDLREKQAKIREMENIKSQLEEELSGNRMRTSEVTRLEKEVAVLRARVEETTRETEQAMKDLQKEQARNNSAERHTQSLQSKQESLLVRTEVLDAENKELKGQLAEMEEEKDKLLQSIEGLNREKTQAEIKMKEKQFELDHLLADKESLEQMICTLETTANMLNDKLEEAKERERLIVEYPDINGPVNPDLSGTGDILLDMENQVKANNIRIHLLETQNDGLRNSIAKLQKVQEQEVDVNQRWAMQPGGPHPLWNPGAVHYETKDHVIEPDYYNMENKYNTEHTAKSRHHQPGLFKLSVLTKNQNKKQSVENQDTKNRTQTGVHTLEFDDSTLKQKTSPPKERASIGHRPLTGNSKKSGEEFIVGKVMRPGSASTKRENTSSLGKSRPNSGKTLMTPVNTNSISAYIQLKKAGKQNLPHHDSGAKSLTAGSNPGMVNQHFAPADIDDSYHKEENYMCINCDKMYTRQKDLDIHMCYCTG